MQKTLHTFRYVSGGREGYDLLLLRPLPQFHDITQGGQPTLADLRHKAGYTYAQNPRLLPILRLPLGGLRTHPSHRLP